MRSSEVRSVTQMFPRCRDFAKQQRPATVGNTPGTSPINKAQYSQAIAYWEETKTQGMQEAQGYVPEYA